MLQRFSLLLIEPIPPERIVEESGESPLEKIMPFLLEFRHAPCVAKGKIVVVAMQTYGRIRRTEVTQPHFFRQVLQQGSRGDYRC
jgi:hypothetical protein